jgi:hypothetical protein
MTAIELEIERLHALRTIQCCLLRLKWLAAATRFEIAMRRHDRALKYAYKYGYNPDQPRVPADNTDGGQWTDGSTGVVLPEIVVTAGGDAADGIDGGTDGSGNGNLVQLAGDIPTGDSPEIPEERPPTTRLRNIVIRRLAARFGPQILILAEAGSWIFDHKEEISSFFDAPKTLEELQKGTESPAKGYDIHHIVERGSANKDGSEADLIDAPENLVRIPRWKHWLINGFYQTESDEFGGLTPREYLKGKSWEERTRVGLDALGRFGILRR